LSGLYRLKNSVNKLGTRLIDRRYKVGRELAKWQADLVADLGGEVALSTQQRVIVDLCVRSKLLIDSIDVWLLSQKSLVNARKRTLIGVVKERQGIADGLTRNLQLLGLKRVERTVDWRTVLRNAEAEDNGQSIPEAVTGGDEEQNKGVTNGL
jgi:hypothetical protein